MKIFLDMDGVIADFFGGLEKHYNVDHWKKIPDIEERISALKYSNFFDTLETFDTSHKLVEFVRDLVGDDYGICSSPLRGDVSNSSYWKRVWLTRHGFLPNKISNVVFTGNKAKYAVDKITGTANILVDDKPSNIDQWNKKGGIGIRYQANEDDIGQLIEKIKKVYNEKNY